MVDFGNENPKLLARCRRIQCTLGKFADRVQDFVEDYRRVHPLFMDTHLGGKSDADSPPLRRDLTNLRDWIFERAINDRVPITRSYTNLDEHLRPTGATTGNVGFNVDLTNLKDWDDKVSVYMSAGAKAYLGSNVVIMLPRKDHPEFMRNPLPRQLLEIVIRHWPVRYASYALNGWHDSVNRLGEQEAWARTPEIGWLTYIDDASIADALPPEIPIEPLGPGILFQLTPEMSQYGNPEHVALGLRVRQALADAGKLRIDLEAEAIRAAQSASS